MLEYAILRWKLFWLERGHAKTSKHFDLKLAEANKVTNAKERNDVVNGLESQAMFETQEYDEEVYKLHTWYLRAEARRLIIPLDPWRDKEAWTEGVTGERHMTQKAINDLRAAVRTEKKLRREAVLMWVPLFTALTGLFGAGIGLLFAMLGVMPSK